jgi:hypothetical protein
MARFFKLNKSKPEQIPSIRKSKMKLAAALIASVMALPALGLNTNAWDEVYSTTNIYTQFFDVDSILPFIYVLSLDGEHRVVRLVTGIIYQDGPYSCVQLPWRCRNSFAMSNQPLQLGTRINPEDDVVVLRRVYGPGPTIVRAATDRPPKDCRQDAREPQFHVYPPTRAEILIHVPATLGRAHAGPVEGQYPFDEMGAQPIEREGALNPARRDINGRFPEQHSKTDGEWQSFYTQRYFSWIYELAPDGTDRVVCMVPRVLTRVVNGRSETEVPVRNHNRLLLTNDYLHDGEIPGPWCAGLILVPDHEDLPVIYRAGDPRPTLQRLAAKQQCGWHPRCRKLEHTFAAHRGMPTVEPGPPLYYRNPLTLRAHCDDGTEGTT